MQSKTAVVFLCTGNSCRSQMAEGFLRAKGADRFEVYSAGTEPAGHVHPRAVEVMAERGVDLGRQRPKHVSEVFDGLQDAVLIAVCGGANETCPRSLPGMSSRLFWPFEDPAKFVGTPEATLAKFREVRDKIEKQIDAFLKG